MKITMLILILVFNDDDLLAVDPFSFDTTFSPDDASAQLLDELELHPDLSPFSPEEPPRKKNSSESSSSEEASAMPAPPTPRPRAPTPRPSSSSRSSSSGSRTTRPPETQILILGEVRQARRPLHRVIADNTSTVSIRTSQPGKFHLRKTFYERSITDAARQIHRKDPYCQLSRHQPFTLHPAGVFYQANTSTGWQRVQQPKPHQGLEENLPEPAINSSYDFAVPHATVIIIYDIIMMMPDTVANDTEDTASPAVSMEERLKTILQRTEEIQNKVIKALDSHSPSSSSSESNRSFRTRDLKRSLGEIIRPDRSPDVQIVQAGSRSVFERLDSGPHRSRPPRLMDLPLSSTRRDSSHSSHDSWTGPSRNTRRQ